MWQLRSAALGATVMLVSAALLFALDVWRPTGTLRLAGLATVLVIAPAYLAFGFAAFSWSGAMAASTAIWSASVANGFLYGAAALALFRPSPWPRLKRALVFLGVVWGVPGLAVLIASAV